ncbi:hypothetical protein ABZ729_33155 [Streptomyces sp. NPDC006678]|uniref:hypothetical protein n=1 Tax=Streptomyces sp. NPDC006678 TaxID=3157185 RepID=UPI0033E19851
MDKAWAAKGLSGILAAPGSALKGVSDRDGELKGAFGVTTIAEPAEMGRICCSRALAPALNCEAT